MMQQVTILIPEQKSKKWLLFNQNYETFSIMLDKGVFNVKNGNVVLHFDNNGMLQTIERADILYSKRFEKSYQHLT